MEKEKVQELLEYATTLYGSNISIDEIEKAMIRQGADEELAKEIVGIVDQGQRKEKSSKGKYAMIIGAGILFIGVFLTAHSYYNVGYGEKYFIYWKAILFGFLGLIGGFADFIIGKKGRG